MIDGLRHLVERIERHPMLQVTAFDVSAGLSEKSLAALEREYGRALPGDVKALYAEADGCLLEWGLKAGLDPAVASTITGALKAHRLLFQGQREPYGRLNLLPLRQVLFGDDYVALEAIGDNIIDFCGTAINRRGKVYQ
jgi:hypothetical protein